MPSWAHTDFLAGLLGAFATVAAMLDRTRTGRRWRTLTALTRVAVLEQMPFAVVGEGLDPARGRHFAGPTHHLYTAADAPVFVALHPGDLAEACTRLGVAAGADLGPAFEQAIAAMPAADCARLLCFGRSSAAVAQSTDHTADPGGPWARRGMVVTQWSEDYGHVTNHTPVARFGRTSSRAGAPPRRFGSEHNVQWAMNDAEVAHPASQ
jgi:crotonobetainyl-CoA:carnitine CoA-transferase CaiB-like acyl-CoA transferase